MKEPVKHLPFCELNAEEFDKFSADHPYGSVFQTSKWYKLQASVKGRGEALMCGLKDDAGKLYAASVFVRQHLPMGICWGFAPRGPLLDYDKPKTAYKHLAALWGAMRLVMGVKGCIFLRLEWPVPATRDMGEFRQWGLTAHAHFYPQHTMMVDLEPGEDEILKQMKQKGRYNIKVAKKHGVKVKKSKDVKAFYKLMKQTTARDAFSSHKQDYYENMLEIFGDEAELYLAEYDGKVLAGAIVSYWGGTCTYHFGASSNSHRNVMAPYLLHWEIMKAAKARGMKTYDLFGVAPEVARSTKKEVRKKKGEVAWDKKHKWAGVTGFKEKFGGKRVEYWAAREKPNSWLWYLIVRARKMLRFGF